MQLAFRSFVAAAAIAAVAPAQAHHSFAAFNALAPLTLRATVVSFEWRNPHAWLQVSAPDAAGAVQNWGIELGAPAAMLREGWRPRSIAPGDKLTLVINPNRNGTHGGSLLHATKADGSTLGGQQPK